MLPSSHPLQHRCGVVTKAGRVGRIQMEQDPCPNIDDNNHSDNKHDMVVAVEAATSLVGARGL